MEEYRHSPLEKILEQIDTDTSEELVRDLEGVLQQAPARRLQRSTAGLKHSC